MEHLGIPLGPLTPGEAGTLAGNLFMGAESLILLGFSEEELPMRSGLRKIGVLLREFPVAPEAIGELQVAQSDEVPGSRSRSVPRMNDEIEWSSSPSSTAANTVPTARAKRNAASAQ